MKKAYLSLLTCVLLALAGMAHALQLTDLHLPLTRTEADRTFSKDYEFQVLSDATVRRTWNVGNRVVSIDFDMGGDKAIFICLDYKKPVSRKEAVGDAKTLSGTSDGKWVNTKKSAVENVGIRAGAKMKRVGSSYIFLEGVQGKKVKRLIYYAKAPTKNRWDLEPMQAERRTAMGSTSASGNVKALIQDEERRRSMAPTAVAAASTPATPGKKADAPAAKPDKRVAATSPQRPKNTARPSADTKPNTPAAEPKVTAATRVVESKEDMGGFADLGDLSDLSGLGDELAEAEGISGMIDVLNAKTNGLFIYILGACGAILLLIIWSAIAGMRRRARARANFLEVFEGTPEKKGK